MQPHATDVLCYGPTFLGMLTFYVCEENQSQRISSFMLKQLEGEGQSFSSFIVRKESVSASIIQLWLAATSPQSKKFLV